MLKWIAGSIMALCLLGGGVALGLYYYAKQNANVEGTRAAAAYERLTEKRLQESCSSFLERYRPVDEVNSDAQYQSLCNCFADSMFEKMRDVPPDKVETYMQNAENNKKAQVIMEKCANKIGLN